MWYRQTDPGKVTPSALKMRLGMMEKELEHKRIWGSNKLIQSLVEKGIISPKTSVTLTEMRDLSNRLAHGIEGEEFVMSGHQRWVLGAVTGMGILGAAAMSGLVMLAHYFVATLSRPHTLADHAAFSWKLPPPEPEPPLSHQRALLFHSIDGTLLRGDFWAQPQPAPTIVICHGYRITRTYLRPVAALEYKYGYNVLLFDFRGHGGSESVATSGGNAEVRDLQAALTVASQQPETLPGRIIIHGFSMGASVALLTAPHPEVAAIIADSAYARLDEILRTFIHWELTRDTTSWAPPFHWLRNTFPLLSWATVAASAVVFRLRYGHALIARPDTSFKRWRSRSKGAAHAGYPPILLIHGARDLAIPITHAYRIAAEAKAHAIPLETYFPENSAHCGAYGDNPAQYIQAIQQFLAKHLGDDFPGGSRALD